MNHDSAYKVKPLTDLHRMIKKTAKDNALSVTWIV